MSELTQYEIKRLKLLAKKAGIDISKKLENIKSIKLSRAEIQDIIKALINNNGEAIVIMKKNGHDVRVYKNVANYLKQMKIGSANLGRWWREQHNKGGE